MNQEVPGRMRDEGGMMKDEGGNCESGSFSGKKLEIRFDYRKAS
ncbi:hypothetical protein [Arthrospiribacter ruber]|nr:hypothetical protein [Arthrospiribacter ruber]